MAVGYQRPAMDGGQGLWFGFVGEDKGNMLFYKN